MFHILGWKHTAAIGHQCCIQREWYNSLYDAFHYTNCWLHRTYWQVIEIFMRHTHFGRWLKYTHGMHSWNYSTSILFQIFTLSTIPHCIGLTNIGQLQRIDKIEPLNCIENAKSTKHFSSEFKTYDIWIPIYELVFVYEVYHFYRLMEFCTFKSKTNFQPKIAHIVDELLRGDAGVLHWFRNNIDCFNWNVQ